MNSFVTSKIGLFIVGLISSLIFAPISMLPFAIPFFLLIKVLLEKTSKKALISKSYCLFLGHYVAGHYWVCISLFLDVASYWFLIPFALFLLPAYMAIFPTIAVYLTSKLPINYIKKSFALAIFWVITEVLREKLFTGFPWNMIGYSLADYDYLVQFASIFGVYGLSFVVVLVFSLFADFILHNSKKALYYSLSIITFLMLYGGFRFWQYEPKYHDFTVKIVQANIPQKLKWAESERAQNVMKHINMSGLPVRDQHIIWSESSFNEAVSLGQVFDSHFKSLLTDNSYLITGAVRLEGSFDNDFKIYNSMIAIDKNGQISDYYDKIKLVPFGEFVPFKEYLPINKITHGMVDFSEGTSKHYINIGNSKVLPLICYESIFSGQNYRSLYNYDYALIITNDAWFGNSSGPYQHFAMAKVRAVELGLPVVRSAYTGISGVIDPLGRVIKSSELNAEAVIVSTVPKAIIKTVYSRFF